MNRELHAFVHQETSSFKEQGTFNNTCFTIKVWTFQTRHTVTHMSYVGKSILRGFKHAFKVRIGMGYRNRYLPFFKVSPHFHSPLELRRCRHPNNT